MEIELADDMPDGWKRWIDWHKVIAPDNGVEIEALESDHGRNLGYVRLIGRRSTQVKFEEQILSVPTQYTKKLLLRDSES